MKHWQAVESLAALAQETRLSIFRRLVRAGPDGESAGNIASALDIPSPTLSFHLKELEKAGLVDQRRESRSIIYSARYDRMRSLLSYLMKDCCAGHPEICNIVMEDCRESPARTSACG